MPRNEQNPRRIAGARPLLFERLTDLDVFSPTESVPLRAHGKEELQASVRHEVVRLLNTRCPPRNHRLTEHERTVIDYGLPDFSALSPRSPHDQRRLASMLAQTIATYEPRLQQVRITVERPIESGQALLVRIDAGLLVGSVLEPISFPVVFQSQDGLAVVEAHEDD